MENKKQGSYEVFGWFKTHVLDSKLEPSIEHHELVSDIYESASAYVIPGQFLKQVLIISMVPFAAVLTLVTWGKSEGQ